MGKLAAGSLCLLLGGAGAVSAAPALAAPAALEDNAPLESDPLESVNRGIFWINERLDGLLIEPLGRGWALITPLAVRNAFDRFFTNLRFPVRFVGTLLQGRVGGAAEEVGRFIVNTSVGLGGFFDPATGWGLELNDEDFGQALGRWGVGARPYLVLPLFGPSNPRDALSLAVDSALSSGPALISRAAGAAVGGLELLNTRALLLEDVRQAKAMSFDYYVFRRNAYLQRRRAQVWNGREAAEEPEDDLYELEDDED